MPKVMERIEAVRSYRLSSKSAPTRKIAETPTRFHVENIPTGSYMVVPEVSSERRLYLPIGFLSPNTIASNKLKILPDASLYHMGVLSSSMHMAWMRYVGGRLKSDYQYLIAIVYNNFPWPSTSSEKRHGAVEAAAQAVLDARASHPGASLADLYDPVAMPPDLRRAHQILDRAVDAAYEKKGFASDAERVAFLFELYRQYTTLLPAPETPKKRRRKKN